MTEITEDKNWKEEAQANKESMESITTDAAWIPLPEVQDYLLNISRGLESISNGIKTSLEQIEEKLTQGETQDDN